MIVPSNKTALLLAWHFFKGNYALNFGALALLSLLSLLGIIPVLGILFVFGYWVLSYSVQIYFARAINEVDSLEQIEQKAAQTKIADFFVTYIHIAAGAFLGVFTLILLFMMLFGALVSVNMDVETLRNGVVMSQSQMVGLFLSSGIGGIVMLLVGGMLLYFFPAAMGEAMVAPTFGEAFKRIFWLFLPSFWKKTLNKEYFLLILLWSLIVMVAGMVVMALSASLILLPFALVATYLLSLYNAAIYLFAARLAR